MENQELENKDLELNIEESVAKAIEKFMPKPEEKKVVISAEEKLGKMEKALRDVANGRINRITIDKTVNAEGTDNIGGYLVPVEYSDSLISKLNQYGIARKYCTIKQMTRDKMNFPTVSTDLIAYNPSEGTAITASNYVFGNVQLDTTKYAVLVPITNELIADSAYSLLPEINNSAAIGFNNKEDALLISQLASCTTSATIVAPVSTSLTGAVGYQKLIDVIATLESANTRYLDGAVWIMSPTVKAQIRKISDTTGQPIMQSAQNTQPETLLGYPVVTSNLMPAATTSVTGTNVLFFGNLNNCYFGDRQTFDMYVAKEGTIGSDSLLEKDMSAYRVTERIDVKLVRTDAIAKLQLA